MNYSTTRASIIILTYNQESTVSRAIESVLKQKCSYPYEIVIADDGSSDGTREIAQRYADTYPDRIRMMPLLPNRGIVDNYFDAFETCVSEYIGDCAGDDEWICEDRLEKQIRLLDENRNTTVVFTDVEECMIDDAGNSHQCLHSSIPSRKRYMRENVPAREVLIGVINNVSELPYTLSAALYRKESVMAIYNKNKEIVRSNKSGVEDIPIMAALASQGDAAFLPIVGYRYFIDGESASNNLPPEKMFNLYKRVTETSYRLSVYYNIDKKYAKTHISKKLDYLASQINHAENPALIPQLEECRKMWGTHYSLRALVHLGLSYVKAIWKRCK